MCVFPSERDPAVIYSAVRIEEISYGQIAVTPKRKRGTAALHVQLWAETSVSGPHAKLS